MYKKKYKFSCVLDEGVRGSRGVAPHSLLLCHRWRWVVTLTPRQLNPPGKNTSTDRLGGWVVTSAGLDSAVEEEICCMCNSSINKR
jgi:hypothetical protein